MHWYVDVLKRWKDFSARAGRKEFWMFVLINFVIQIVLTIVLGMVKLSFLVNIYGLVILVPFLAVGWRRMHDTDRAGWWILIPIVGLVLACMEGTPGANKYGPPPISA